jgi:hypothetical protein
MSIFIKFVVYDALQLQQINHHLHIYFVVIIIIRLQYIYKCKKNFKIYLFTFLFIFFCDVVPRLELESYTATALGICLVLERTVETPSGMVGKKAHTCHLHLPNALYSTVS